MPIPAASHATEPAPSATTCVWDLLPDEQEPGRLRSWVSAILHRLGLARFADDLTLIADELAANALRHGGTPAHVTLSVTRAEGGSRVRLEVTDAGAGFDAARVVRSWDDAEAMLEGCSGRGLLIVAGLSRRWGTFRRAAGHTVWAELAVVTPAPAI
ncbi:ATP-binding protein [Streptomyces sp. NPDC008343]|uniref:ATP-binding protein n=1 Tax=Streptomyces sp. NPDC008343 TaxID=3364828 RepID=UPI0036F14555